MSDATLQTLCLVVLAAPLVGFVLQYALLRSRPIGAWVTVCTIGLSLVCSLLIAWAALQVGGQDGEVFAKHFGPWTWLEPGGGSRWTIGMTLDGLTAVMLVVVTLVVVPRAPLQRRLHAGRREVLASSSRGCRCSPSPCSCSCWPTTCCTCSWGGSSWGSAPTSSSASGARSPRRVPRRARPSSRPASATWACCWRSASWAARSGRSVSTASSPPWPRAHIAAPWLTRRGPGALLRRGGQERPVPPARLAARRHGGPHTRQRPHPRRDHGGRRRLPARPDGLHAQRPRRCTSWPWSAAITALFAGFIAVAQDDIKRVLAYSTISQLGYMFLGARGRAPGTPALFHLTTHAFFKALLFLGSGSVIHACHHEQDMRKMGGLWKKMPITGTTFLFGVMAISGVPWITSGFFSKDGILSGAYGSMTTCSGWGWRGAVLTAFYMVRPLRDDVPRQAEGRGGLRARPRVAGRDDDPAAGARRTGALRRLGRRGTTSCSSRNMRGRDAVDDPVHPRGAPPRGLRHAARDHCRGARPRARFRRVPHAGLDAATRSSDRSGRWRRSSRTNSGSTSSTTR